MKGSTSGEAKRQGRSAGAVFLNEAWSAARAARVTSALIILVSLAACVLIQLTTGRTAGIEGDLLDSVSETSSRLIVVRAAEEAQLPMSFADTVEQIDQVEKVTAFGPARDVRNTQLGPSATAIAMRTVSSKWCAQLAVCSRDNADGTSALATSQAASMLGVSPGKGTVNGSTGETYGVAQIIDLPDYLAALEPLIVLPQNESELVHVNASLVVAVVHDPRQVNVVARTIEALIPVSDKTKIQIESGGAYAQLRATIQGQLGTFGYGLLIALVAGTGAVVGIIVLGISIMRRREFGRRRSLGATRAWIVRFVVTQVALLAAIGAVAGMLLGAVVLGVEGSPIPAPAFSLAIVVLVVAASSVFAAVPALLAARRDPVAELRVP